MKTMFDLTGKKAVVTGAGRGIGRDVALGLASQGADITLWSRTRSELEETAGMIRELGREAWVRTIDVSDVEDVRKAAAEAKAGMGRIDILINNAGINVRQKPEDVTEEAYDKIVGINMRGAFFTAQAVGRIMIEQNYGKIINTSSQSAKVAMFDRIVYGASKAALDHMTRCLALEWAKYNINVNAIAPGFVETPMTAEILKQQAFRDYFEQNTLIHRFLRGNEVAAMAVYLAAPASDMMTGQIIYIDGGWTIH